MTLSEYHKRMIIKQVSKDSDTDIDLICSDEIDSSLSYEEAKNEMYEKYGIYDEPPDSSEYNKYLKSKQEKQFKRYCQTNYNLHRDTKKKVEVVGDTIYTNSLNTNLIWISDNNPEPFIHKQKRNILYKRFKTVSRKKSISFDLNGVCRKLPNINETFINGHTMISNEGL